MSVFTFYQKFLRIPYICGFTDLQMQRLVDANNTWKCVTEMLLSEFFVHLPFLDLRSQ